MKDVYSYGGSFGWHLYHTRETDGIFDSFQKDILISRGKNSCIFCDRETSSSPNILCLNLIEAERMFFESSTLMRYIEHIEKGWSLPDLVAVDLVPSSGRLSRFFSLTRQFFGPVAEQTLQQQAPALL